MKLRIHRDKREILGLGDIFKSGKSYENLLRGFLTKMLAGGMSQAIVWLVKKYGEKHGDLDMYWMHWTSDPDADFASEAFVTTDKDNAFTKDNSIQYRYCVYKICTADADDCGFVGDWDVFTKTKIYAHTKDSRKITTLRTILDDCQIYLAKYINAVDSMRLWW